MTLDHDMQYKAESNLIQYRQIEEHAKVAVQRRGNQLNKQILMNAISIQYSPRAHRQQPVPELLILHSL